VTFAIGLELSADTDVAAIAVAGREGARWAADLAFYGSPDAAAAQCARLAAEVDNCGVFADPMPSAGILDDLRAAAVWLRLLGPEEVAAAAWQFTTEVRFRRVRLGRHPALRESMRAALPRPLSVRFAFERKRVTADMSPLNACAFALLGLRRNEAAGEPGVYVIDGEPPLPLPGQGARGDPWNVAASLQQLTGQPVNAASPRDEQQGREPPRLPSWHGTRLGH
jgi:hypothetical protein